MNACLSVCLAFSARNVSPFNVCNCFHVFLCISATCVCVSFCTPPSLSFLISFYVFSLYLCIVYCHFVSLSSLLLRHLNPFIWGNGTKLLLNVLKIAKVLKMNVKQSPALKFLDRDLNIEFFITQTRQTALAGQLSM